MIHTTPVPFPAWCKWCEVTTEQSTLISGDGSGITLNHDSCGRIMSEMSVRELKELDSTQRADVAKELVNRANLHRKDGQTTMKNFDDLSDAELIALTEEEIRYYIDAQCAEEGIRLLPPGGPPVKPDKGTTADDLELWEIAGHHFRDRDDAERVAIAIGQTKSRMSLEYISGPSYRKKAVPATDSVSGVSLVRVLSQERHAAMAQLIEEQEQALKTFNERQREYDKITTERARIVTYTHDKLNKARLRHQRRENLKTQFARYIELARGDREIAARFLAKAEPDAREVLAGEDIPWPETEYQRTGTAVASTAPIQTVDVDDVL